MLGNLWPVPKEEKRVAEGQAQASQVKEAKSTEETT